MRKFGVSHPIPTKFANRIYDENKRVFIGKSFRKKAHEGDKFVIYESQGAKAYTGWGDIKFIGLMKVEDIIPRYKNKLMLTEKELKEYAGRRYQLTVIEFNKHVFPDRFVIMGGKYIKEDEYTMIEKNKD